jgi:glycosyltransferase involved in cell wall biosynthesis
MIIEIKGLDIVIPVYNEGGAIKNTLLSLINNVKTNHNIFICYDEDTDTTLQVIKNEFNNQNNIFLIKNQGKGVHSAVVTGLKNSLSDYILVMPADDDYNHLIIDQMIYEAHKSGADVICPSRFSKNSKIVNGPFFKFTIVKIVNYSLYYLAGVPSKDSTNGFRLFSKKVINNIKLKSSRGFTYSIEYLLKAYEQKMIIRDFPADWYERKIGKSRFKIFGWSTDYLEWYFYAWKIFLKNFFI